MDRGRTNAGTPHVRRHYHQVIAKLSSASSNIILQIRLFKLTLPDRKLLNIAELGHFFFETLKIPLSQCLALDFMTGRYDMEELLVRPDTNLNNVLTQTSPTTTEIPRSRSQLSVINPQWSHSRACLYPSQTRTSYTCAPCMVTSRIVSCTGLL